MKCSWEYGSAVLTATTIHLIAGPRTTTTGWQRFLQDSIVARSFNSPGAAKSLTRVQASQRPRRIPGKRFLHGSVDERKEFADWLTSPDNPYFAKAMAGRVWEALMGQGLVSPVDDMRATNPPSHPELLDRLSHDFVQNGYKLHP